MQTHFHLAIRIGELKDFSFAMRDIKRDYAFKFHSKYKLSGPIWRDRFKSLLIENENYLYACGKYIERNPVKAQLVQQEIDWEHSSSRHYELNEVDELIDSYPMGSHKNENLILDQQEFESGSVIGSDFFKFQFFKGQRQARPVPCE
jgi:putative transposase